MKRMSVSLGLWVLWVTSGCYTRIDYRFDDESYYDEIAYDEEEPCPTGHAHPPHHYPPAPIIVDQNPVPHPGPSRPPERRDEVRHAAGPQRPAPEIRRESTNPVRRENSGSSTTGETHREMRDRDSEKAPNTTESSSGNGERNEPSRRESEATNASNSTRGNRR